MNQETNTTPTQEPAIDISIDVIAIVKILWNSRKSIIKYALFFIVFGLIVAISTPKEYTATTTIVPASQGKKTGKLSGLAAIAGVNLSSGGGNAQIAPSLYPQVVTSIPFQKELIKAPLSFEEQNGPISYEDYYTNYHNPGFLPTFKKYTIGLPGLIIGLPQRIVGAFTTSDKSDTINEAQESNILKTTLQEEGLMKMLGGQLSVVVNSTDGYITISATMPQALPAAQLTQQAQMLLQQYVIGFKIQKSSEELSFIKARSDEAEQRFKSIQLKLANYRDSHKNLSSARSQTRLEELNSQYRLSLGLYSELVKQLETQELQVKKDTPVFTVLKPVSVPNFKSRPNRPYIFLKWSFIGVIIGIGIVLGKLAFFKLKEIFVLH